MSKSGNVIKNKKKYSLLVIRLNNSNQLINSKPCSMCINMMIMYGISKVYYSNSDGNIEMYKVKDIVSSHLSKAYLYKC